ncbi:MAG: DUF1566 domain-containing protein [Flavobacteriales bacterium]|nr:DUF1566 domain-containing protein [Flavobacteriales bacterium]
MKKVLKLTAVIIGTILLNLGNVSYSQVGIGTATPDPSAILDLTSTTKGMLISRVTQVQRNAIVSPATGLLVYQIDNTPAYYYNAGTPGVPSWARIFSGTSAGLWDLSGNAGTTVGTNFLGTTDAQDFAIYTNNAEKLRVTSGGNIGIGTVTPTSQLHIDEDDAATALYVTGGNTGSIMAMFERDIGSSEKFSIHTSNSDVWTRYEVNPGVGTDWNVGVDETNDNFSIWTGLVAPGTTDKLSITPAGNVGIGTTAPAEILHLKSGTANKTIIRLDDSGALHQMVMKAGQSGVANPAIGMQTNQSFDLISNNTAVMQIQNNGNVAVSNGNVGIGTLSPLEDLHIEGATRVDMRFHDADELLDEKIWDYSTGVVGTNTFAFVTRDDAGVFGQTVWQAVRSGTNVTSVSIPNGNVGIGTTNPEGALHIAGVGTGSQTVRGIVMGSSLDFESIELKGTSSTLGGGFIDFGYPGNDFQGRIIYSNSNNAMSFHTAAVERVRITSAGNVGIGTTSPIARLHLAGTVTENIAFNNAVTLNSTNISQQTGLDNSFNINPAGASLSTIMGTINLPILSGSALTIGNVHAAFARVDLAAGFTGTLSNVRLFSASNATVSGGSITNQYGIYVANLTTATNNWAVFADGTTKSYFGGNVGIGTTAPGEKLEVAGNVEFSGALMPGGGAGTSGQVLTSQGPGTPPVWQAASGGGYPTEITNELNGATPCVGTGCGTIRLLRTCAIDCANLTFNAQSDWRVPSVEEIINLIPVAPGNTSTNFSWTVSTHTTNWGIVRFSDGGRSAASHTNLYHCRCVR